jgi:hypothetical protein
MARCRNGFLAFVGAEYIGFGLAGLAAVLLKSSALLLLVGFIAMLALVTPTEWMFEYGSAAFCHGAGRACSQDASEMAQGQGVVTAMCMLSIAGGTLGLLGAYTESRKAGRAIWILLSALSAAVALWNAALLHFGTGFGAFFAGVPALLAAAYGLATWFAFRKRDDYDQCN